MCDYSLEHFASRPAKVGDTLVTTKFKYALTGGFCAVSEPNVAVCLLPGHRACVRAGDRKPSGVCLFSRQTRSQRGAIPACE